MSRPNRVLSDTSPQTEEKTPSETPAEILEKPGLQLEDIVVNDTFEQEEEEEKLQKVKKSKLGDDGPSLIIQDWLYLGNRFHASRKQTLLDLGITHILNVTETIPCYYPSTFKYAQIPILDVTQADLFEFFEAAAQFIDLCNPLTRDFTDESDVVPRILVHCAMGVSRSASIVISYLISRKVSLKKTEWKMIGEIRRETAEFYGLNGHSSVFTLCISSNDSRDEDSENEEKYDGLSLNDAYYFVLNRRESICPNHSFCEQLGKWEKLQRPNAPSTLEWTPMYRNAEIARRVTERGKCCKCCGNCCCTCCGKCIIL